MEDVHQIEIFVEDIDNAIEFFSKNLAFTRIGKKTSNKPILEQESDGKGVIMRSFPPSDPGIIFVVEIIIKSIKE